MSEPSFTCPRCGRTSHHPKDVEHRYCGACHEFFPEKHCNHPLLPDGKGGWRCHWCDLNFTLTLKE